MNRAEVLRAIKAAKLGHLSAQLAKVMQPTIDITTGPLSASRERAIGTTRIGGLPDLPPGAKWPTIKNRLLIFAGQFNMQELSRFPAAKELPKRGLLSFFHDERVGAKVLYTPSTKSLRRLPAPDGTCNASYAAILRTEWTLPEFEEIDGDEFQTIPSIVRIITEREDRGRYYKLRRKVRGKYIGDHILGCPDAVQQGEIRLGVVLDRDRDKRFPYIKKEYRWRRTRELVAEMRDLRILLQCGVKLGLVDDGILYFWIRRQDLRARRFDRVFTTYQTT